MQIAVGYNHACALLSGGKVKCWGINSSGELGLGDTNARGDEPGEMGMALPAVDLGAGQTAAFITAGAGYTCAQLASGGIKCWGTNGYGSLGLGDEQSRGDEPGEMGDNLPVTNLAVASPVASLSGGYQSSCSVFGDGTVKCWGINDDGQLGLGNINSRGDEPMEMGDYLPFVELGNQDVATAVSVGWHHSCALLVDGRVKCWGDRLYLGNHSEENLGDEPAEMGDILPPVDFGGPVSVYRIDAAATHTCALLNEGSIRCWGLGSQGKLGTGSTADVGINLDAKVVTSVDLGAGIIASDVSTGLLHSCALTASDNIKCWGFNGFGQLGVGDTQPRGHQPEELGDSLPVVELGQQVKAMSHGYGGNFNCVLLTDSSVKCWGINSDGQLGLGDTEHRGDQPGEMGDNLPRVKLFATEW